jgi:hypothetical protein
MASYSRDSSSTGGNGEPGTEMEDQDRGRGPSDSVNMEAPANADEALPLERREDDSSIGRISIRDNPLLE